MIKPKRVHRSCNACVLASLVLCVSSEEMRKHVFLFIRESGFENNLCEYSVDKSVKKGKKIFCFLLRMPQASKLGKGHS